MVATQWLSCLAPDQEGVGFRSSTSFLFSIFLPSFYYTDHMSSNLPFSCTQQLLTKAIWIKLVGDKKTFIVSFTTWTNQNAASCKECKIKLSLVEPEKHTRLFLQRLLNFHLKLTRSFSKEQCSLLNYKKL